MKFLTMLRNTIHVRTLDRPLFIPGLPMLGRVLQGSVTLNQLPYSSRRCLMGPYHFGGCGSFPQVLLPDKFAAVFES